MNRQRNKNKIILEKSPLVVNLSKMTQNIENGQENHPLQFFIDLIEKYQFIKLYVDFKYTDQKTSNGFFDDKSDTFIYDAFNEETGNTETITYSFKTHFLKRLHPAIDDLFLLFDSKVLTFKSIEEQFLYFDNIIGRLKHILEQSQQPRFSKFEYVHSNLLDLLSKVTQKYCRHNPINQPHAPKQIDGNKLGMDIVFSKTMKNLKIPELQLKYITDTITEIENRILKNSASPNIKDDQWFQIEHEYLSFYQQKLINYNMRHNINKSSEPPLNLKFNRSIMSRYPATTYFFTNPAIKLDLSNTHKYDIAFPFKKCEDTNPQNPLIEGTSVCQNCYSKVLVKLLDEIPLNERKAFIEYQLSQQSNGQVWLKELHDLVLANEKHFNRKYNDSVNNYLMIIEEFVNQIDIPADLVESVVKISNTIKKQNIKTKEWPLFFSIKESYKNNLFDLYHKLSGIFFNINSVTDFETFSKIFSGKALLTRIRWEGTNQQLHYFIQTLYKLNIITNKKNTIWGITVNCFIDKNGNDFEIDTFRKTVNPRINTEINTAFRAFGIPSNLLT